MKSKKNNKKAPPPKAAEESDSDEEEEMEVGEAGEKHIYFSLFHLDNTRPIDSSHCVIKEPQSGVVLWMENTYVPNKCKVHRWII